ncbi:MAG: tyrosine-protein phosphatase [Bacteroidaceae bacterium]|nr:tyrosine-protein phosphatase [Bacteroidaceae bacterium]
MRKINVLFALTLLAGSVSSQDIPKYCLENDSVNHYLNDFSYDTIPDLNVSYILNYLDTTCSFRQDWPKPVELKWTAQSGIDSQWIEVSESDQFTEPMTFQVSKDASAYEIYNLIPGKHYYYRIAGTKDGADTQIENGQFETTGFLRMLRADGTLNVRDMGGWTGLGGHKIAYGKLFRGARLKYDGKSTNALTDEGIAAMRDAGIRAELDLRSNSNVPSSVSALAVQDGSGKYDVDFKLVSSSVNARMLNYDKNDANIIELKWIISELKAGKPVYYHCSMGADRTGTLGFLIGALLGMSEGDLAKDYEITTFCSKYTGENPTSPTPFARLRNYTGKMGSVDNNANTKQEYMFAPLIDKLNKLSGNTIQRKIYDFFKKGVEGYSTKISEADLDWFIDYMVGYKMVKKVTLKGTQSLKVGEQTKLEPGHTPVDATDTTYVFKSNNKDVVTVDQNGVVTAVAPGFAYVIASIDGLSKSLKITVTADETQVIETPADEEPAYAKKFNMAGQETDGAAQGLFIMDGKTYIKIEN